MNRQLLKGKAETLSDVEIAEVLEYISIMESLREQVKAPDPLDELIIRLLSEAMKGGLGNRMLGANWKDLQRTDWVPFQEVPIEVI
jgi:hypothetical protein